MRKSGEKVGMSGRERERDCRKRRMEEKWRHCEKPGIKWIEWVERRGMTLSDENNYKNGYLNDFCHSGENKQVAKQKIS